MVSQKTSKSAKKFSLEIFRLYGNHPNVHLTTNEIKNDFENILYTSGKINCNHQLEN